MMVKICGIRSLEAALAAVEAGAGMLGYNFYPPSARYIDPGACRELQRTLAGRGVRIATAAVFVNESNEFMQSILAECDIDYAQLSGDESAEQAARLGVPWFKGIRPQSAAQAAEQAARFDRVRPDRSSGPELLVDAYRPGEYGGTGLTADWSLAGELAPGRRMLLAGGLQAENVAAAVRQVRPWGVDVASGVESAPGIKDPDKIKAFTAAALAADI